MKDSAQADRPKDQGGAGYPDVILVGDSHTQALAEGCAAIGVSAALLKSGGIHWNQGKIRVFPARRGRTPQMPALRRTVDALQERMGVTDIFDGSLPVIASIGYHTGHLARAFGAHGHLAWPPPPHMDPSDMDETLFASTTLLRTFVEAQRRKHFQLLDYIAERCQVTVILPPRAPKNRDKVRFRHNIEALTQEITRQMHDRGIRTFDPNAELASDAEVLPENWVKADGFHGTSEYGQKAMQALFALGRLGRKD